MYTGTTRARLGSSRIRREWALREVQGTGGEVSRASMTFLSRGAGFQGVPPGDFFLCYSGTNVELTCRYLQILPAMRSVFLQDLALCIFWTDILLLKPHTWADRTPDKSPPPFRLFSVGPVW